MKAPRVEPPLRDEVDVLVIGSGAAGLSAAITAASRGLEVMLVEKEPVFGGTTAWSGGWMWIPGNPLAAKTEAERNAAVASARAYLQQNMPPQHFAAQAAKINAYLADGPAMLKFFSELPSEALVFELDAATPDFHQVAMPRELGRAVRARAIQSRRLGDGFRSLRPPLDLLTIWGMGIESGQQLTDTLRSRRRLLSMSSARAFGWIGWYFLGWLSSYLMPEHGPGQRLVNGNALVARLLLAARQFNRLTMHTSVRATELVSNGEGVAGARLTSGGATHEVLARHGVVLACGGFPHDADRWKHMPDSPGFCHWSAAPRSNSGDGLRLGEAVQGVVQRMPGDAALWAPLSLLRRGDGSVGAYPHFIDRAKPGVIAVNRAGKRFCNETVSYHEFVRLWQASAASATRDTSGDEPHPRRLEAWLICDAVFFSRYGLGAVKPPKMMFPFATAWARRSGYLKKASSIRALAEACKINPDALYETVNRFNQDARLGRDTEFGRGSSRYAQSQGDALTGPNPCVAPIEDPPYYAVRLWPGSLGTFAGLQTDETGAVLRNTDAAIPGLYACGNDMAAPMGGFYPASGLTLGAAMIFGHRIGQHLAAEANSAGSTA